MWLLRRWERNSETKPAMLACESVLFDIICAIVSVQHFAAIRNKRLLQITCIHRCHLLLLLRMKAATHCTIPWKVTGVQPLPQTSGVVINMTACGRN